MLETLQREMFLLTFLIIECEKNNRRQNRQTFRFSLDMSERPRVQKFNILESFSFEVFFSHSSITRTSKESWQSTIAWVPGRRTRSGISPSTDVPRARDSTPEWTNSCTWLLPARGILPCQRVPAVASPWKRIECVTWLPETSFTNSSCNRQLQVVLHFPPHRPPSSAPPTITNVHCHPIRILQSG